MKEEIAIAASSAIMHDESSAETLLIRENMLCMYGLRVLTCCAEEEEDYSVDLLKTVSSVTTRRPDTLMSPIIWLERVCQTMPVGRADGPQRVSYDPLFDS